MNKICVCIRHLNYYDGFFKPETKYLYRQFIPTIFVSIDSTNVPGQYMPDYVALKYIIIDMVTMININTITRNEFNNHFMDMSVYRNRQINTILN